MTLKLTAKFGAPPSIPPGGLLRLLSDLNPA
jgi:hypothetical protein